MNINIAHLSRNVLYVFLALAIVLVPQAVLTHAGTVTLTGVCTQNIYPQSPSNYIAFNISNSGNDSAVNLNITPHFNGFSTSNQPDIISILPPLGKNTHNFYIYNISSNGTYAEYFSAKYGQSTSSFSAVFPCLINVGNAPGSPIQIELQNVMQNGNNVTATISSASTNLINVSSYLIIPQGFAYSPKYLNFTIANQRKNVSFMITEPNLTGASFTIALVASYKQNMANHATLMSKVLYLQKNQLQIEFTTGNNALDPVTEIGIIVILIIIALILLSHFKVIKRKRTKKRRKR